MINQKPKISLILPILIFFFVSSHAAYPGNSFFLYPKIGNTDSKILVGFKGGINFTQPVPITRYSLISANNPSETGIKNYKSLISNIGYQYGFVVVYNITDNIALSFQPGFSQYAYSYTNNYTWTDNTNPVNQIDLTYDSKHLLHYMEFPLIIQYSYDFGPVKPYLQGGIQYGMVQNATAKVSTQMIQRSLTGDIPLNVDDNTGDVSSWYIRSRFALIAGVGVRYDFDAVLLALDANYIFGLNNIVNESERYSIQNFSGSSYDIPDDINLHNIVLNVSLLFPINQALQRINDSCKNLLRLKKR